MTETLDTTPTLTFAVAVGAEKLGVTEDWYTRQLRSGKLPGHKIGRQWRLTESDVQAALDITFKPAAPTAVDPAGLTPTSRRRMTRGSRR